MIIKPSLILFFCCLFISAQWKNSAAIPTAVTGKWKVQKFYSASAKKIKNISTATIQIDPDGMTTGFTGCNKIRTNCSINGDSIRFGTILSGRKFCEKEYMDLEDHMKDVVKSSSVYRLNDNLLTLYSGRKKLVTFIKE